MDDNVRSNNELDRKEGNGKREKSQTNAKQKPIKA